MGTGLRVLIDSGNEGFEAVYYECAERWSIEGKESCGQWLGTFLN